MCVKTLNIKHCNLVLIEETDRQVEVVFVHAKQNQGAASVRCRVQQVEYLLCAHWVQEIAAAGRAAL